MAYVIAEPCIGTKDTACVDACPVDCIHPKKDEPAYATEELLYIDPWNASTAEPAFRCARFPPSSRSMICRRSGTPSPRATPHITGVKRRQFVAYYLPQISGARPCVGARFMFSAKEIRGFGRTDRNQLVSGLTLVCIS